MILKKKKYYHQLILRKTTLFKKGIELISKRNKQNRIYEVYKNEIEDRNDIKYGQRIVSPFVIGYGMAVVASSSHSSALLSYLEKNKKKRRLNETLTTCTAC